MLRIVEIRAYTNDEQRIANRKHSPFALSINSNMRVGKNCGLAGVDDRPHAD
jgi:hypothetical protein